MMRNTTLPWLVPLIGFLTLIAAGAGLFAPGGEGPFTFATIRGQTVEMYGMGLYQNDTRFAGAGFKGADAALLLLGLPLLMASYFRCRRGSTNAALIMTGLLFYFLYYGISMLAGAAFNSLFLVYTALFSASLFAVIVALTAFDAQALAQRVLPGFPHRGMAAFICLAGVATFLLWMSELAGPLLHGGAPELLGPYTTLFTHGFDTAVIMPAAVITAIFLWQRKPLGYLLAAPMLILCTMNGVIVLAQTASQTLAGIVFPIGVYIGMIGSWAVMGALAIGLTISFFRNLSNE
jgi:hypothetical protein